MQIFRQFFSTRRDYLSQEFRVEEGFHRAFPDVVQGDAP
jgi:hypothetical protein